MQIQTALSDNFDKAAVTVRLEIDSLEDIDAKVRIVIRLDDQTWRASSPANLKAGVNEVVTELAITDPALWWPCGQGDQPLYTVEARLEDASTGERLHSKSSRVGIRDIRWQPVEGAPADFPNPFQLVINGRVVRTMGSNLIPPDLLFGRIQDQGVRLIRQAKHAGMNWLRMWGGGVIMPDSFYEAADEAGILISQEYPLACCMPEEDDELLRNVEVTARNILKQLRNHPCIAEWSGGNEMYWEPNPEHKLLKLLERLTAEEDGRIFQATCPIKGSRHNPWWYYPESHYRHYNEWDEHRFGEFGCQTPAHLEVWQREIPPTDRWPIAGADNPVLIRKNVVQAVFGDEFWLVKKTIDELFGPAKDLPTLIHAGQFIGAEGLRYAVDALRRRGRKLGGFSTWDYNEPWPNGAGSYLIDYDGRPLMNYDFMKQALAPAALSLRYDSILIDPSEGLQAELWMVSDLPGNPREYRWQWRACDRNGRVFGEGCGDVSSAYLEVNRLADIRSVPPAETAEGPWFVELELSRSDGECVGERLYVFGRDGQTAPLAALQASGTSSGVRHTTLSVTVSSSWPPCDEDVLELHIRNTGRMFALFCSLHPLIEYRTDPDMDRNNLCVPPGGERRITIRAAKNSAGGLTLAQTGWRIDSWNADSILIPPSDDVLLSVGRRDHMCREFMGASNPADIPAGHVVSTGRRPDPGAVPYRLDGNHSAGFVFDVQTPSAGHLRIHTGDQAADGGTMHISINGKILTRDIPKGYGFQDVDPAHLADPATVSVAVPDGLLKQGENTIAIRAEKGWLTLDALDLVVTK